MLAWKYSILNPGSCFYLVLCPPPSKSRFSTWGDKGGALYKRSIPSTLPCICFTPTLSGGYDLHRTRYVTPQMEAGGYGEYHDAFKSIMHLMIYMREGDADTYSCRSSSSSWLQSVPQDGSTLASPLPPPAPDLSCYHIFPFLEKLSTPSTTKIILQAHVHGSLQKIPF